MQQLVAFPMLFLGGSYFPVESSGVLAPVVNAVPLTHLNDALRAVINDGGGVSELWVSWLVLAAWAVMGFVVSMRLFRWQ
jgi:ABC-type multidrug transport system permease subunit